MEIIFDITVPIEPEMRGGWLLTLQAVALRRSQIPHARLDLIFLSILTEFENPYASKI
jgi:hypothetical protein